MIRAAIALKWMELEGAMVWERWEWWEMRGEGGEKRRHIPEAHQGLKCLCHGFWARQAMPGLSQAFRPKISVYSFHSKQERVGQHVKNNLFTLSVAKSKPRQAKA